MSDAASPDERWRAERPIFWSYDNVRHFEVAMMAWRKRKPNSSAPTIREEPEGTSR